MSRKPKKPRKAPRPRLGELPPELAETLAAEFAETRLRIRRIEAKALVKLLPPTDGDVLPRVAQQLGITLAELEALLKE